VRVMIPALTATALAGGLLVSGCASVSGTPAMNTADMQNVDFSQEFESGTACQRAILGIGPFGSSSVIDAAADGDLDSVDVVETSQSQGLFWQSHCTTVYSGSDD